MLGISFGKTNRIVLWFFVRNYINTKIKKKRKVNERCNLIGCWAHVNPINYDRWRYDESDFWMGNPWRLIFMKWRSARDVSKDVFLIVILIDALIIIIVCQYKCKVFLAVDFPSQLWSCSSFYFFFNNILLNPLYWILSITASSRHVNQINSQQQTRTLNRASGRQII